MEKEKDILLACFGSISFVVIFTVISVLVNGWVISLLWLWFIVPLFHLPSITILQAFGLALIIGRLTKFDVDVRAPERSTIDKILHVFGVGIASPLFTLLFGWIIFQFMK